MYMQAVALEVIFNPYADIDYSEAKAYSYYEDGCNCECNGYWSKANNQHINTWRKNDA